MGWVKLDTSYLRNGKLAGLPPKTVLLHLSSILWTAEHLTDGHVPSNVLATLSQEVGIGFRGRCSAAGQLVSRRLWDVCDDGRGGWIVHDFVERNHTSTRAIVEHERRLARERMRRWRDRATGE